MPPCPAPDTCNLYLVRHGATQNNLARPPRLQGRRLDAELSPQGLEQARSTAKFLALCPIDAIYCSPLARARQTALPISQRHDLPLQTVDDLIEVDVGHWEGMTWLEVQAQYPEQYRAFIHDSATRPYFGGETLEQVRARVVPALTKLLEANLGRTIAVVAHNIVNRAYLAHLMEIPLSLYRMIPQDNCGVNLFRYRAGRTAVITINSVFHVE